MIIKRNRIQKSIEIYTYENKQGFTVHTYISWLCQLKSLGALVLKGQEEPGTRSVSNTILQQRYSGLIGTVADSRSRAENIKEKHGLSESKMVLKTKKETDKKKAMMKVWEQVNRTQKLTERVPNGQSWNDLNKP